MDRIAGYELPQTLLNANSKQCDVAKEEHAEALKELQDSLLSLTTEIELSRAVKEVVA